MADYRTLSVDTRRQHLKQPIELAYTPDEDVDSIQIRAEFPPGLETIELLTGGVPLLSFTPDMLKKLPVTQGWVEILQPFLPVLPMSGLGYAGVRVDRTFQAYGAFPPFELRVRRCRPWPADPDYCSHHGMRVPMLQPFPEAFEPDVPPSLVRRSTAPDTHGIFCAPNEFKLLSGMGYARCWYNEAPLVS